MDVFLDFLQSKDHFYYVISSYLIVFFFIKSYFDSYNSKDPKT